MTFTRCPRWEKCVKENYMLAYLSIVYETFEYWQQRFYSF
jgi:hypothetical protein